jgi:hypothetical protein
MHTRRAIVRAPHSHFARRGQSLEEVLLRDKNKIAKPAATSALAPPSPPPSTDPAAREAAEKIKNEGNALMGQGDIHGAIAK